MAHSSRLTLYRAGALGDTLLAVPLLRMLRARNGDAVIHFVGNAEAAGLLREAGLADRVSSADDPRLSALVTGNGDDLPALRTALGDPDCAIVFTTATEAAQWALRALDVPGVVADPLPPPGQHVAEYMLIVVEEQGGAGPASRTAPPLPRLWPPWTSALEARLPEPQSGKPSAPIYLHPGAGAAWKRWPLERYAALAHTLRRRGRHVTLIEGPAEEGIVAATGWSGTALRDTPLRELAHHLSGAGAYVGNDSGVTHLAALLGVPTVAIFGPTHPGTWGPLGPHVRIVRACMCPPSSAIRVCHDEGCLEAVSAYMVLEALSELGGG